MSRAQADASLASVGLTKAQRQQILTALEASTVTKTLTAEEIQEKLAKELNSDATAKALLLKSGLITQEELEKNATIEVTAAKLNEAFVNGTLSTSDVKVIAGALGITSANAGAIISFKTLTAAVSANVKAFTAWLISNPAGWLTMAVGAIAALGVGMVYLSNSVERTKKKAKEATETYAKIQSEIKDINSELQTTKNRIDELNAKQNITLIEAEELTTLKRANSELERELRLREAIAIQKGKEANDAAIKYFGSKSNYGTTAGTIDISGDQIDILDFQIEQIKELEEYFKNDPKKDFLYFQNEKLLKFLQKETAKTIEIFMEQDDSLMDGYDEGFLKRLEIVYNKYDEVINGVAPSHTDILSSILAKVDFKDTVKELEELGKSGELSIDILSSKFPNLISYLDEAGISVQELYQYIMALSNPDAVNYANVEKQLFHSISKQQDETPKHLGDILSANNFLNLINILSLGKEELVLDAYLKVRAQYGDSPEGWTVEDWIYNIQQKLNNNPITLKNPISLSLSETIDQLNTRLKPAMDSLKSAWQNIFTDDEADLNSIDILSTCDSIKSKLDDMAELGLKVEYSSYEDFVRVLRNSESTTNDVKEAFNSLATSITQAALSGAEDFETMKAAIEDLGVVNSEMVAFDALISNTEALKEAGIDLASVTNERLLEFANESVAAENAAQAYDMLRFHKELCSMQEMNTSNEVANLRTLAENAGYTGSIIQYLTELEQIYQELASGTTNPIVIGVKLARAAQLQALIQNAAGNINYKPEVDFHGVKESASSAAQSFTDLLDKELAVLDQKMEAGYINFNDYIQARLALIENYYNQGKIKADEYYSYLENHYKQELSYRDKVIKAVTRRIDKEIKSLEKEKDAIKENYQIQIDALENQKTLLEDVNKERQRQIDLQKALYELERAKNQRTKLVYSEGGGIHYVADDTAIRDAENEAENARHEIQISEIEKSITLLEKSRDAETDAIDDMIDKLQEYKEAWNDITSAYEESQEDLLAAQFFGQEWEEDIINCRTDVLNKFKDDYADIQQSIVDMAWESANEQIRAAQEAAKGADGIMGSAHKIGNTTEDEPSYYYIPKKYHTGLQQGTVNAHSFDDDFKLVQKVGLGEKEVPAILKEGEAVATPAQISNIADGLRTADSIHSVQAERPYFMDEQERLEQCAALLGRSIDDMLYPADMILHSMVSHNMEKMTGMDRLGTPVINAAGNNKNVQPVVNQYNTLNCPNVTNSSGVEYLQKELGHLSLKAMQETIRRY